LEKLMLTWKKMKQKRGFEFSGTSWVVSPAALGLVRSLLERRKKEVGGRGSGGRRRWGGRGGGGAASTMVMDGTSSSSTMGGWRLGLLLVLFIELSWSKWWRRRVSCFFHCYCCRECL